METWIIGGNRKICRGFSSFPYNFEQSQFRLVGSWFTIKLVSLYFSYTVHQGTPIFSWTVNMIRCNTTSM